MPDARYPTESEFWKRLDKRNLEPDLKNELRRRAASQGAAVHRIGPEATVIAVIERLLPGSAVPARVLASFAEDSFDKQMGRGDERRGVMARADLLPAGFNQLDEAAGGSFAALGGAAQDRLLAQAEEGQVAGPAGFDSAVWFRRLRDLVLLRYGADPRGMVQMGYPGPSYQTGHVWLDAGEIEGRVRRRPGYMEL
jgi:hypothetical protein